MAKEIEINIKAKVDNAKKGFDGVNVSAKDLQERIKDLDVRMQNLTKSFGVHARETKAGQIILREREIALNQLMNMTDGLDEATKNLTKSINFSRRDVGILATQMLSTADVTGKLSGQIGALASGLMVGGVYGAAFAGFAAVINLVSDSTKEATGRIENLTSKLKDHWSETFKANQEWQKFSDEIKEFSTAEILESIKAIDRQLTQLGNSLLSNPITQIKELFTGSISATMKSLIQQAEMLRKQFNQPKALGIGDLSSEALKKWRDFNDTTKKSVDNMHELRKVLNKVDQDLQKQSDDLIKRRFEIFDRMAPFRQFEPKGVSVPSFSLYTPEQEREMIRREREMQSFAQSSANIFAQNMNQAWQNIFGEANSLFEQLVMNWGDMLMQKVSGGLFDMLFGAIDPFGFARSIFSGGATASKYRVGK